MGAAEHLIAAALVGAIASSPLNLEACSVVFAPERAKIKAIVGSQPPELLWTKKQANLQLPQIKALARK